jgi:hypothetical protein
MQGNMVDYLAHRDPRRGNAAQSDYDYDYL